MSNGTRGTRVSPQELGRIRGLGWLLLVTGTMAGCESSTSDPTGLASDVTAAEAVQEVWSLLPSTLELEEESLAALESGAVDDSALVALVEAGALAEEAEVWIESNGAAGAEPLETAADTVATRGLLGALSATRSDAVVTEAETAFDELDARLGSSADPEVRDRLREAREALDRARAARAAGDRAGAVRHAARAADALRWLRPEAKATAAVERARAMLARAVRLAGDDPEPPIERALARAETLCSAAERALESERWRLAVTEAYACARVARAVIVRLSAGVDPEVLAERAEAVVAHAAALFERVSEEAGDAPDARVAELLAQAETLLGRARIAFDEGSYRRAIGFGAASAAHSLRALHILRLEGPGPLELRATAAVEAAASLGLRVREAMDEGTSQNIVEAAERADGLLEDARVALDTEAWRLAWSLAQSAILVYTRILLAIG